MIELETLHIVSSTNDNYAKPLAVMLHSLFKNKSAENFVIIYVLYGDLSDENKQKLIKSIKKFNAAMKFVKVEKSLFDEIKVRGLKYLSRETYYRISIPDLLDKDIEKVLYLDCDLIVNDDVTKLWRTNIDDYYLAAVEKGRVLKSSKQLPIPKNYPFFNAGVLLINLKKWRKKNVSKKVFQFIYDNPSLIQYCSQDPLNAVLYDKWLKLDTRWNVTTGHIQKGLLDCKPAIVHFTGEKKPCNHGHPLQQEYFKYLHSTPWEQDNVIHVLEACETKRGDQEEINGRVKVAVIMPNYLGITEMFNYLELGASKKGVTDSLYGSNFQS